VTLPTAGWYDDPNDGSVLRWWDGTAWAKTTQPKQSGVPSGWYDDPASPGTTRWWDGTAWGEHEPSSTGQAEAATVAQADGAPTEVAAGSVATIAAAAPALNVQPAGDPETPAPPAPAGVLQVVFDATDHAPELPTGRPIVTITGATIVGETGADLPAPHDVAAAPHDVAATTDDAAATVTADPPPRSRRTLVIVAVAVLALLAVAAGAALMVRGRLQESHLADPPSTEAERNWGIAGDSLGTGLAARGVTASQLPTVCAGGFQDLWDSPLPTAVQGVDENRARKIYVDACVAGFDHPVGLSSPSAGASTKPSTGATAKASSSAKS
jgi:hypothetical protein